MRLDVPGVEHDPPADLVALADALHLLFARVGQQRLVDRVGHHLQPLGIGVRVEAQDVAARGFRDREHELAALHRAAHHELRVPVGETVRQVLREQQVDAVVDGHDRLAAAQQRQHVVGRMEEVRAQRVQLARDRDVLPEAVAVRLVHDRHEVVGQVAQDRLVRAVTEQEVGGLAIEVRQMTHEVPHVGADAVVPPFAGVDRDLHGPRRRTARPRARSIRTPGARSPRSLVVLSVSSCWSGTPSPASLKSHADNNMSARTGPNAFWAPRQPRTARRRASAWSFRALASPRSAPRTQPVTDTTASPARRTAVAAAPLCLR